MFVIALYTSLTSQQKASIDGFESAYSFVEKICRGSNYATLTEYSNQARQWKTRESAEKALNKLLYYNNQSLRALGYKVIDIKDLYFWL